MLARRVRVDPVSPAASVIREAAETLGRGGVVAFPTDTFYGLAADPRHPMAIDRLYRVKGRPVESALSLVVASEAQLVSDVGPMSAVVSRLAERFWPGPLTLVVPARPDLAAAVHANGGAVAVRVPAHPVATALARAVGHALTATSANRSGAAPASSAEEVFESLGEDIDLILDAGRAPGGSVSTIVDVTGDRPRLVRAGAVAWDRVVEFLAHQQVPPL